MKSVRAGGDDNRSKIFFKSYYKSLKSVSL